MNTCARTRFVYFSRTNRGRWKKQSHDDKKTTNTHSTPRDRGNLMSNTTFRRFDMFRLILLCITNAGSAAFCTARYQCAWCSIGCGGRAAAAAAAAAAAFGPTTSFLLSFFLCIARMYSGYVIRVLLMMLSRLAVEITLNAAASRSRRSSVLL